MNATHPAVAPADKKRPLGASADIPPRPIDLRPHHPRRKYWLDNSPFKTSFVATLSALFPEGETFFVKSVRHYRNRIQDPLLKAQVAGFIGQESLHTREHQAINALFQAQGFPVRRVDRDVGRLLRLGHKVLPRRVQLAITVALEHYTAILGEQLLRDDDIQARMDPDSRALWLWHALEETEHKTVAYDVLEQVAPGYALRVGTMIPVTALFLGLTAYFHLRLLAADGKLLNLRDNLDGLNYLAGPRGIVPRLLPAWLDFFRPGFHPSQHDTEALVATWRERLFGNEGLLHEQWQNRHRKSAH